MKMFQIPPVSKKKNIKSHNISVLQRQIFVIDYITECYEKQCVVGSGFCRFFVIFCEILPLKM